MLGLVLYEMVTGVHPFLKETRAQTIAALLQGEPRPLGEYLKASPELLQQTINKMLAKDPQNRYQSAHEIGVALNRILQDPCTNEFKKASKEPPSWRFPVIASALTLLTLLAYWGCFVPS